ncbi:MAG: CcmD family protein [Gemmatimonadota bacterium]
MSDWFYIGLAFGLTWSVIAGYTLLLHRRRVRAEAELAKASAVSGGES